MDKNFNSLANRLEKKIYGTEKGYIRFNLLQEDILQFIPDFKIKTMSIFDAGGGTGRFSRFCASKGHSVLHCDISSEMLKQAEVENLKSDMDKQIQLLHRDLTQVKNEEFGLFDLILLHGVAEWMNDPKEAIRHCISLLKPGAYISLLIYNKNKYIFKRGVNGRLLVTDKVNLKSRKLTPTGKMSPLEILKVLSEFEGDLILQSGIRIFNHFLKIIEPLPITQEDWLEQERLYYREEPFASLGEHTHILWKKT